MKAVIPAAGLGTRFLPSTKAKPKEMLTVVDKPTIQYIVEEAVNSGIKDTIIITGRRKRSIENHFDKDFELEHYLKKKNKQKLLKKLKKINEIANIHYTTQGEPKGLANAISYAKRYVGNEYFAVMLGDDIFDSKVPVLKQMIKLHKKYKATIIAVEKVPSRKVDRYGIIDIKKKMSKNLFLLNDLIEKPNIQKAPSRFAVAGRYILSPEIFKEFNKIPKGAGGEYQLTDAIRNLLKKREKVYAYIFEGKRYDTGTIPSWIIANVALAMKDKELKKELKKYLILKK